MNIEQKNLPALLKAAETLQIRGLSGGDIFAKESYKRLAELEQAVVDDVPLIKEEVPKKKQKIGKQQNNSILEKALTPRLSQSENTNESAVSDQSGKDGEYMLPETLPNPVYHRLEMKVSPGNRSSNDNVIVPIVPLRVEMILLQCISDRTIRSDGRGSSERISVG